MINPLKETNPEKYMKNKKGKNPPFLALSL